ncbi:MAG: hypothetical protein DI582_00290 [Azospirillum brasilense]|nr:MAG: hypothetical protein DI582_00290 [Azospirillum brasilense]
MRRITTVLVVSALALSACTKPPASAFYNRGTPESLLDVSSEVVNLSVADQPALAELSTWIKNDQPTRAELYCNEGDPRCTEALKVLDLHGVPTMTVPSGEYSVALVYERLLARDCRQQFVDNSRNPYNAPHPSFGCSIAANMVQHVSNKQQFISPNLTDVPPATNAVQARARAYIPNAAKPAYSVDQSVTQSAQSD